MKEKEMIITACLSDAGDVNFFIHNNLRSANGFPIDHWIRHYGSFEEAAGNTDLFFEDKESLEKNLEATLNTCIFSAGFIPKNVLRMTNTTRRRVKKNLEKSAKQVREYYVNILTDTEENRINVRILEITLISVKSNNDD